jgi:transposase
MSMAAPSPEPVFLQNAPLPVPEQLPDDLPTLKRMILELLATLRQRDHDLEHVQHRLHLLLQRLYGARSERFNPHQPLLFVEGVTPASEPAASESPEAVAAEAEQPKAAKGHGRPHGRRRLPEDLPQRPVHHELPEAQRLCVCGQTRIEIAVEDGGKQLDWQPASYFVWQHWIHKYICPNCATKDLQASPPEPAAAVGPVIVSAPKPPMPIAKGLPGPGLLAHIIVSKYFDHLPLYRQESISERQGVLIPRSTSCDWMAACAELMRPLYELMIQKVLESVCLHTDDTPVKNLGHEAGTTDKARLWVYVGDRAHPYNVFDFTLNHKRDGPQSFLADFHGYLQADAFSGYDALYLPHPRASASPILEVACNAHARRKFFEAKSSDELGSHQALAYYAQLYDLERAATENNFDDEQKLRMRQELALPILDQFKAWIEKQRDQALPKSPMAEAVGYTLKNWTALVRYTEAGCLSIDNNVAEREMKRIAIGRKNWLFVGSAKGGNTAAVLFSFTSTCHRLKAEPWAYLQDVLSRLPSMPVDRLEELLPDRWQAVRKLIANSTELETSSQPSR